MAAIGIMERRQAGGRPARLIGIVKIAVLAHVVKLMADHRAMGVPAPAGLTIYGWTPPTDTYFDWIFGPYWSPLPVSGTAENAQNRRFEPDRRTFPVFEYIVEHPQFVEQQEYTVHQSIGTTLALWLFLNAETNR